MSGPPNLGDNRFTLLADGPRAKKKRANQTILEIFPELPTINKPDPKYINQILNKSSADNVISTTNLLGVCRIKCEYHSNLNFSKGTIYAPYLINVPESEIINELNSQGVVDIYKYQKKNSKGKMVPCGVILLTFDRYIIPEKLDISWHKVKVRPFFPNPMRCKNCQLLGHTQKWWKNIPKCENCALPPHIPEECTRTFCANCSEEHPSSSKECKIFKQQKEILKIKIKEKCSLKVAKEKYFTQKSLITKQIS